tara:strand:- start:15701 stop:15937 length:237 start_codon:yes stop_codon:yes gene_type:complete
MIKEIVYLFISLKTLLTYTLQEGNEKVYHMIYSSLKKFNDKIENIYFKEILLEKMKMNVVSLVVTITIINYYRVGIIT